MAHGKPDWGLVGPKQTIYGLDDVGEAVARLGSPVIWDRRGDIVLLDSFEYGTALSAPWTSGVGDSYNVYTGASRHGSLSMIAELVGAAGSRFTNIWTVCTTAEMVNGFEISYSYGEHIEYLVFEIMYWDGVWENRARARYTVATADLDVQLVGGAYQNLDNNLPLAVGIDPIHVAKVVADFGAGDYVRIIMDERTYPIPGVPVMRVLGAGGPYIMARFFATCDFGQSSQVIIDRVIVTQNEPV